VRQKLFLADLPCVGFTYSSPELITISFAFKINRLGEFSIELSTRIQSARLTLGIRSLGCPQVNEGFLIA
jgi:hypothetical protein